MHENQYDERNYMKSAVRDYDRLPAEFIRGGYLAAGCFAGLLQAGTMLMFGMLYYHWAAEHSHIFGNRIRHAFLDVG